MPQVISNRTIDDQFGDSVSGTLPSYNPAPFWKPVRYPSSDLSLPDQSEQGASCTTCAGSAHLDPALAFDHTWHDSSQFPAEAPVSVSLEFTGTAVWVFCIAPPIMPGVITNYNLNFTLDDGAQQGTFSYTPTSNSDAVYNIPVVSLPSLANTGHTLVISTDNSVDGSIFLFDYAVYTSVEDTPAPNTHNNAGTIAGCVFGGIFLIVLVLALLRCRKHRRNRKPPPVLPVIEPFPPSPAAYSGSTTLAPQMTNLSRNPSTNSPSTLIHQLRLALDTAVSMKQSAVSPRSPQSPSSGVRTHAVESEDRHTPPPLYQARNNNTSKA
ncbi:hypothetical protein B0H12DRAFT_593544 [Mycena haematopus]|nr:hypothetical protein B0H12DRAFT_593544 [Mycena haematopus]